MLHPSPVSHPIMLSHIHNSDERCCSGRATVRKKHSHLAPRTHTHRHTHEQASRAQPCSFTYMSIGGARATNSLLLVSKPCWRPSNHRHLWFLSWCVGIQGLQPSLRLPNNPNGTGCFPREDNKEMNRLADWFLSLPAPELFMCPIHVEMWRQILGFPGVPGVFSDLFSHLWMSAEGAIWCFTGEKRV